MKAITIGIGVVGTLLIDVAFTAFILIGLTIPGGLPPAPTTSKTVPPLTATIIYWMVLVGIPIVLFVLAAILLVKAQRLNEQEGED